jgi:hypothetical protein
MRDAYLSQKLQKEQQYNLAAGQPLETKLAESPIESILAQIDRQLSDLLGDAGGLENALHTVLRQVVPLNDTPKPCEQPQSPLHDSLLSFSYRIDTIRNALVEIRNRITL